MFNTKAQLSVNDTYSVLLSNVTTLWKSFQHKRSYIWSEKDQSLFSNNFTIISKKKMKYNYFYAGIKLKHTFST